MATRKGSDNNRTDNNKINIAQSYKTKEAVERPDRLRSDGTGRQNIYTLPNLWPMTTSHLSDLLTFTSPASYYSPYIPHIQFYEFCLFQQFPDAVLLGYTF